MARFVEFDVMYSDDDEELKKLDLPGFDDGYVVEKGIIDIDQITGIYKSREKSNKDFTETTLYLSDGTKTTVMNSYDEVKSKLSKLYGFNFEVF